MNDLVLGNIPRIFTALAGWLACMLYIGMLRPRLSGWRLRCAQAGFLLAQVGFLTFTGNLPVGFFIPCILVSALLMLAFLYVCCEVTPSAAGYYCARAFILAELAASLEWQIYYYLYQSGVTALWGRYAVLALVYAMVFGLMLLLERRHREETRALIISRRELCTAVAIAVGAYLMSNLSYVYADTPFTSQLPTEIFNIRTLMDMGGVAILYAYHAQISALHMKFEVDALQNMLHTQYAQYQQSQESIDLVNQKYHDLKHQIAALRAECDSGQKSAFLDRMEADIKSYEAQNKTGNRVLDTVITGKSLYCQNHDINFTCVADGGALDFLEVMDLCTLFGNALDNAIEAVERVRDGERRLIHLSVARQKGFLRVRVENYYEGELCYEGELPVTTKVDKRYHGYGLKSIRHTAEKYGGSVTISTQKNWFELRILIPITE